MYRIHRSIAFFLLGLVLFGVSALYGQDGVSTQLHFAFIEARGPRSPFVVDGNIIFTYQQEHPARLVAAAFAHEDFTVMHPYQRYTPEGGSEVFLLAYPVPPAQETLVYRIIVDGLWMEDPANSSRIVDANGTTLSRYKIPSEETHESYPLIGDGGEVTFVFSSRSGMNVSVSGTFNSWDPFMYPMKETAPGEYRRTLHLAPGEYIYHFSANGSTISDPLNPRNKYDSNGNRFSYFAIKPEPLPDIPVTEKKRFKDRIPFIGGS